MNTKTHELRSAEVQRLLRSRWLALLRLLLAVMVVQAGLLVAGVLVETIRAALGRAPGPASPL